MTRDKAHLEAHINNDESIDPMASLQQRMSLLSDSLGYRTLFEYKKRLATAKQSESMKAIRVAIHRSLPFDWVERVLGIYTALWQADVQPCFYSSYDPALLSLNNIEQDEKAQNADVHLTWIDWRLLSKTQTPEQAIKWISSQLKQLRAKTTAPILINNWPCGNSCNFVNAIASPAINTTRQWFDSLNIQLHQTIQDVSNTHVIDLQQLSTAMGQSFWDTRNDIVSHYPFSDLATIEIAKHLGCQLLPALFSQKLKAIVLDLDETLYAGILGEDGIDSVVLTEYHLQLQQCLKQLKQNGYLLALCSRNDEQDAKKLFESRHDFVLEWEDFTVKKVNWNAKSQNITAIADALNIHTSSLIFVDDNPAELLQVNTLLPEVSLVMADKNALLTLQRLVLTPGMYALQQDEAAHQRHADIQAQTVRQELLSKTNGDPNNYLASLNMRVSLSFNNLEHTHRLHDLSQRTNQFNLTFKRYNSTEAEHVFSANYCTLTVGLSDSLSDSGLIGAFVAKIEDNYAVLEECIMSCRALGRQVETIAFTKLLEMLNQRGIKTLTLNYTHAERNQPAHDWLLKTLALLDTPLHENNATIEVSKAHSVLQDVISNLPVEIHIENSPQKTKV